MLLSEYESILRDIQFRDYYFEVIYNLYGSMELLVSCRFMDRDKSKKYYETKVKMSLWVTEVNHDPIGDPINDVMPGRTAKVAMDFHFSNFMDKDEFIEFVKRCIISQEIHEIEEDFYYKGERVFDPHK